MNFDAVIERVDDLIRGFVIRDGFLFKAIDEPTNVFDAIVIRHPSDAECPLYRDLKPGRSIEDHVAYINKNGIKKLLVIAKDIGFLSACPSVTKLELVALSDGEFDYSALYSLPLLEALEIPSMPCEGITAKNPVDYSRLKALRSLRVSGTAEDLCAADKLNVLSVDGIKKGCADLRGFFSSKALSELTVSGCGIKSLNGLEKAEALTSLCLWYDRSLCGMESIRSCAATLRTLSVINCPKITDFSFLRELRELEHLELMGSNEISDLSFLEAMPKLKTFRLSMNVLNGDLTPCLNVPYVDLEKGRKHYNLKVADLPKNISR